MLIRDQIYFYKQTEIVKVKTEVYKVEQTHSKHTGRYHIHLKHKWKPTISRGPEPENS